MKQKWSGRLIDFAMDDIACLMLKLCDRASSPIVRILLLLVHFPWVFVSAVVWLPLELFGMIAEMMTEAWNGRPDPSDRRTP